MASIFLKYGIPSIDTDAVYHKLLAEGGSMTRELVDAFGTDILDADGKVNRKKLGSAVFGHENTPALLHTLNTITHKYVMARTHEMVNALSKTKAPAVLIDAPQLFEAGIEKECDLVIGVLADREVRISRILQRDGITREAALKRINAQKDDHFFLSSCHHILFNNGDLAQLEREILQFMENYRVGV